MSVKEKWQQHSWKHSGVFQMDIHRTPDNSSMQEWLPALGRAIWECCFKTRCALCVGVLQLQFVWNIIFLFASRGLNYGTWISPVQHCWYRPRACGQTVRNCIKGDQWRHNTIDTFKFQSIHEIVKCWKVGLCFVAAQNVFWNFFFF